MKVSKQVILQGLKQSFCIPYIYTSHGPAKVIEDSDIQGSFTEKESQLMS